MFKWKKLGKVFNPSSVQDRGFLKTFAQAPSSLVFDNFVRIYFSCRPNPDENGQFVSYSTFLDLDRKDLTKILKISEHPVLALGEKGCFDEFGTYPISVIRFGEKYLAYYAGWTRCVSVPFNVAIGAAIGDTPDRFEKLGKGPILSYSFDEPFVMSGPKIRFFNNKYYLFYIAGTEWIDDMGRPEPIYTIRMASSTDGLNWTKEHREIIPQKLGKEEAQASPDVFFEDGKYHMFFCYRGGRDYRGKQNGYRIGYAFSNDLLNWERKDELAGIDVSEEGWDSEMISYPHILQLDGKTYMFYLGNSVGKEGFGLAELIV